jgi:hypothetical protein
MEYVTAKSKTEWFSKAENAQVERTIEGVNCLEDMDSMREAVKKLAEEHNLLFEENDIAFYAGNSSLMKPKQKRNSIVTIKTRSVDFIVTPIDNHHRPSYCDKKSVTMKDGHLFLKSGNREVTYKIIGE